MEGLGIYADPDRRGWVNRKFGEVWEAVQTADCSAKKTVALDTVDLRDIVNEYGPFFRALDEYGPYETLEAIYHFDEDIYKTGEISGLLDEIEAVVALIADNPEAPEGKIIEVITWYSHALPVLIHGYEDGSPEAEDDVGKATRLTDLSEVTGHAVNKFYELEKIVATDFNAGTNKSEIPIDLALLALEAIAPLSKLSIVMEAAAEYAGKALQHAKDTRDQLVSFRVALEELYGCLLQLSQDKKLVGRYAGHGMDADTLGKWLDKCRDYLKRTPAPIPRRTEETHTQLTLPTMPMPQR